MDNSHDFYYSEGMYRTTVCRSRVREKRGMLQIDNVYRQPVFTNSDISASCFTSIPSARPPEIANINPQQENQIFTVEKLVPANISSRDFIFRSAR